MPIRDRLTPNQRAAVKGLAAPFAARSLTALAKLYGTDKWSSRHRYTQLYEHHLPSRRSKLTLIEIGIGGYQGSAGGASLRMWRAYFPLSTIVGIDLYSKDVRGWHLKTFRGDQADVGFLREVIRDVGQPAVIIDDGSHINAHVRTSFKTLFPLLAPGGLYAIEDLETSYQESFGGGPPGTTGTSMEMVKRLVDGLNHQIWKESPTYEDANVAAVHAYPQLVFIKKTS